eukprot:CAMPEP_0175290514 /NCGR_PEP_ID=MMETSP0093-20121207/55915_1 /TAXON_ID=311494 /ORGANISM="Alexandrium monilatum, Strain CCMP3105" /LENGTH=75 /DNA_ID=CAMNT_0016586207 /DNA_START=112 /DNA_END=336 /DNA_ORIENTATION=+
MSRSALESAPLTPLALVRSCTDFSGHASGTDPHLWLASGMSEFAKPGAAATSAELSTGAPACGHGGPAGCAGGGR